MRHPHGAGAGTDWKNVRLLVFGLDDPFRFLVRQTFRKLGVRTIESFSDRADCAVMLAHGPDLLLVDLGLSPDDGLAVIERLRRPGGGVDTHRLPILVVLPSSMSDIDRRARALGIEGVVPKPVSGHELTLRVAETLANPQRLHPPPGAAPRAHPAAAAAVPTPAAAKPGPAVPASTGQTTPAAARPSAPPAPPPQRPGGGGFTDDDLAPPPPAAPARRGDYDLEPLGDAEAEARRRREAERRRKWAEAMAEAGHEARRGKDVAALDLSSVISAHGQWLDSKGAEGQRASLDGMDLAGAELSGAVLANASLREADLSDAGLSGARLDGADLRRATLSAADLAGAGLGVAALRHARLDLANLEGAVLRGADLSGAVLSRARLNGADMTGAVMVGADLRAADLSRVEGLRQPQVEKTLCDLDTRLPPGLNRPPRPAD